MIMIAAGLMAATLAAADSSAASPAPVTPAVAPTSTVEVLEGKTAPTTGLAADAAASKIVCRTIVPTGSRLGGERVCKTQADWTETSRFARHAVDKAQLGGTMSRIPGA